jgi:hypothetical protein
VLRIMEEDCRLRAARRVIEIHRGGMLSSTFPDSTAMSNPPAMSTLPLFSVVAVALSRAWFIEGFEAAGAKLPPDVGVACAEGPDVGVECAEGEDESPPHPASARTMLKTTTSRNAD